MHYFASILVTVAVACGDLPKDLRPGETVNRQVVQHDSDSRLGSYSRDYLIHLPKGYTGTEQVPMLFYFHGWGDDDNCTGWCHFKEVADANGFIVVQPNGMTDGQQDMRSWNVGQAGRTDICIHKDVTEYEYTSCVTTKNESICNCGTCYDDVLYISDLTASLKRELCIDDSRIFATGGSYGAMFAYFLAPELIRRGSELRLRAVLPWYGGFYRHMLDVPRALSGTSVFHFHGIHDGEIPMNGSESWDGYIYVPTQETIEHYAMINGCEEDGSLIETPYDGQGENPLLGCFEWKSCSTGARVVLCKFDGAHGIWPTYAEEMMWGFASSLPDILAPNHMLEGRNENNRMTMDMLHV